MWCGYTEIAQICINRICIFVYSYIFAKFCYEWSYTCLNATVCLQFCAIYIFLCEFLSWHFLNYKLQEQYIWHRSLVIIKWRWVKFPLSFVTGHGTCSFSHCLIDHLNKIHERYLTLTGQFNYSVCKIWIKTVHEKKEKEKMSWWN